MAGLKEIRDEGSCRRARTSNFRVPGGRGVVKVLVKVV